MSKSLKGRRYVNLLRCSTLDQDTSIHDQRNSNDAFARHEGMIHAAIKDQEAEGVSGSQTFFRDDINTLIQQKKDGADFDVVLIHDLSRLTRGGVGHGHDVKQRLARVGLEIVSVGDNLPEGDEAELIESVVHYKNRLYSKNLSAATTRGKFSSLASGRTPSASTTPYGFDRLYLTTDGRPTLLVRAIGSGTKLKIDPLTNEIRGEITRNADGKCVKFVKQKDEISKLIPGDPARVQVVQEMFRDHYVHGMGISTITLLLNQRQIAAPEADAWNTHTVHKMLRNSTYLGDPVACRVGGGGFHQTSPERPTPVVVNQALLEERGMKSLPHRRRPASEWISPASFNGEEHAALIVDPEVRRKAEKRIAEYWAMWADGTTAEASRDKHNTSTYFLKKLLRSRQGNRPLCGRTTSLPKRYRYYRIRHTEATEPVGSIMRNQIPAGPVEVAVLGVIREVLMTGDLGTMIESHIKQEVAAMASDSTQRNALEGEDKKLARRLTLIYETADTSDENDVGLKTTISKFKARRREIQQELSAIAKSEKAGLIDVAGVKSAVTVQFKELATNLSDLPMLKLRRLVETLCESLTVDLVTRQLEIDVRLPSWAMSSANSITEHVGLVSGRVEQGQHETYASGDLKIAKYRCEHFRESMKQPICYRCSRVQAASGSSSPSLAA